MPRFFRDGLVYFAPSEKIDLLWKWYDELPAGELKSSMQVVSCVSKEPGGVDDVVAFCLHPVLPVPSGHPPSIARANETSIASRIEQMGSDGRRNIPSPENLSTKPFAIKSWPLETLTHYAASEDSSAELTLEMGDHALDCLELIRFAALEDNVFASLWRNSNEPFFAAGQLAGAEPEWIDCFPTDWLCEPEYRKEINGRIIEFAREYLGLYRLAHLSRHQSSLMKKLGQEIASFVQRHNFLFPRWNELAAKCLDLAGEMAEPLSVLTLHDYLLIENAGSCLRRQLAKATEGLENQIPGMINSFLPNLPVPKSAGFFRT